MAEKYIVNMPLKTTPDDTDLMIIEDAQDTKRITFANLLKPINFNASGNGIAIGKDSEKDAFEVALPVEFNSVDFRMPNGRRAVYLDDTANLNDVVEEWVMGKNGSNYPGSGYWYVHTIMQQNSNQRKQIAYGYANNDVFTRWSYEGTWAPWEKTVDRGSNTNGSYTRFSDGTQICWINTIRTDIKASDPYVDLFIGTWSWTFPASFIDIPTVPSPGVRYGTSASWGSVTSSETAKVDFYLIDVVPRASGTNVVINAIAIGRWK